MMMTSYYWWCHTTQQLEFTLAEKGTKTFEEILCNVYLLEGECNLASFFVNIFTLHCPNESHMDDRIMNVNQ